MYDSTRKFCETLSFIWPKLDSFAGPSDWYRHIGLGLSGYHFISEHKDVLLAGKRRSQTLGKNLKLKYVVTKKLWPWRNFFPTQYFESLKHSEKLNQIHSEESYIHHTESMYLDKQAY